MKKIYFFITTIFLVAIQSLAIAQTSNITETFKNHFNETVQMVHETEDVDEKRDILNTSFSKMITALERIESRVDLSEDELTRLDLYKNEIEQKQNELNGVDGFNEIQDEDLLDFSEYSQQYFEQANRTITLSVSTALLVIILLILLA